MLGSIYCVMKDKLPRIQLGQVWKKPIYHGLRSLGDVKHIGDAYFLVIAKQSQNMWKLKLLKCDPNDIKHLGSVEIHVKYWTKADDIRKEMELQDHEQSKTLIVLYG